jgi:hypothetical protein
LRVRRARQGLAYPKHGLGLWAPKRAIIEQAEAEAGEILRENSEAMSRLAEELRRGPMTGAAVRAIVGA